MSLLFSEGYTPHNLQALIDQVGVKEILHECQKQYTDAINTLQQKNNLSEDIICSIKRTDITLLLGMGASHFANQIIAGELRSLGFDSVAIPISEYIATPFNTSNKTVILVSQSGDSAEIGQYLENTTDYTEHFGISLSSHSVLANALPTLVANGGREIGFAATRSFLLTLVLYSQILNGLSKNKHYHFTKEPTIHSELNAVLPTASLNSLVFTGRGVTEGLANMAALGCMELGQLPCLGFEVGQFRHGPVEALNAQTMVIILDTNDISHALIEDINNICHQAGSPLLIIGQTQRNISQPDRIKQLIMPTQKSSFSSLLHMVATVQALILTLSAQTNTTLGTPRFCSKVTAVA